MAYQDRPLAGPRISYPRPLSLLSALGAWALGFLGREERDVRDVPRVRADEDAGFELLRRGALSDRKILVVGRAGGELMPLVLGMTEYAIDVRHFDSFEAAAHLVWERTQSEYVIVVDIDTFSSTSAAVEALRLFRQAHPGTVVVIASAFFARHDFSGERRAIADASVRLPCGRVGISLAIACGIENNEGAPADTAQCLREGTR
ncbi:hypothetical protein [Frigidibacter sp. ROC022]|uniref:hypothetical protein n=1 Tax=Frigidibacter sp. ROC022 TaxID=2971796 RepID=UPI00215AAA6F|nr:hypothetical protein [Frigidibacter sp. ROC022]MCR8726658.1 hypothetical protein [Frigidibacter sp. ROC022]